MVWNAVAFLLFLCGLVLMIAATVNMHRLQEYLRRQLYAERGGRFRFTLALLWLFDFGYILACVDALLRRSSLTHCVVAFSFAAAAAWLLVSVRAQAEEGALLREKVLEAIRAFVYTIDEKDNSFKGHSRHVYDIVNAFYAHLEDYHQVLNLEKLLDAAILHDIGKINISAEVLNKTDQLSAEEWELLKSHAIRGKEMLDETSFREISAWVMYHHEWVNGNGYFGLPAESIPLESKIISIADTYSALCSDRAWRQRLGHSAALDVIREMAGKQFDRKLVDCFLKIDRHLLESLTARAHGEELPPAAP